MKTIYIFVFILSGIFVADEVYVFFKWQALIDSVAPTTGIIHNGIANVIDYGAIPSDNLDDTQAIQNAINAAFKDGGAKRSGDSAIKGGDKNL